MRTLYSVPSTQYTDSPQRGFRLSKHFLHHLAPIDDLDRSADAAHVLSVGVNGQGVADRAEKIVHGDRSIFHRLAAGVGFAHDLASFDAAAGEGRRESSREMVAATVGIDPRRAAEFTCPNDER